MYKYAYAHVTNHQRQAEELHNQHTAEKFSGK